ncbi:reverse transcriptase [Gossypium australe]|uniref:Reverse transcriptase n=1 Tax=Gossypium australe TaxID=47621 RepID=A0A5B6V8G3_9ROSI|nr:reverse transcriptase [Gossypium australe]
MDFIDELPILKEKDTIWVVVDRLTKYEHFVALDHSYSALTVAQAYFDNIFKLHGLPNSIIFDRDKELFTKLGTELHHSTWYNTTFHSAIKETPYEALYGQAPPYHLSYLAGSSGVACVDRSFQQREATRKMLQFHLKRALQRVFNHKLAPHYFGPFKVEAKIGEVAYHLQLPPESLVHPTFYVS